MAVLLGLIAALAYGAGDFAAGLISRRVHYLLVTLVGSIASLVVTVAAASLVPSRPLTATAIMWGAAAGFGGALGGMALYRGLARGRMGVVAPLSALAAAAIPIGVGVVLGERPTPLAWVGVLLALPAIWLVSTPSGPTRAVPTAPARRLHAGAVDGLLAGAGFALLFIALDTAGNDAGLWVTVAAGLASLAALIAVAAAMATARRIGAIERTPWVRGAYPPTHWMAAAAFVGALGGVATVTYFLATQQGLLSIVAVLTSLYPAATVSLAVIVLGERIERRQGLGLALAAAAVVAIVLG